MYRNSDIINQLARNIEYNNLLDPSVAIGIYGTGTYPAKPILKVADMLELYIYHIAMEQFGENMVQRHPNGSMNFPDLRIGDVDIDVKSYSSERPPAFDIANKNFVNKLSTGETIDHLLGYYIIIPYNMSSQSRKDEELGIEIEEDVICPDGFHVYSLWELVNFNSDTQTFSTGGNAGAWRPRNLEKTKPYFTGYEGMHEFLARLYENMCQEEGEEAANEWIDNVFIQLDEDPMTLIPDDDDEW